MLFALLHLRNIFLDAFQRINSTGYNTYNEFVQ